jgi:hypothetical protein
MGNSDESSKRRIKKCILCLEQNIFRKNFNDMRMEDIVELPVVDKRMTSEEVEVGNVFNNFMNVEERRQ